MSDLSTRHATISADLAGALRELGTLRAGVLTAGADLWRQTNGYAVTERKEIIRHQLADLHGEVATLETDVEALRVELNHVELMWRLGSRDGQS